MTKKEKNSQLEELNNRLKYLQADFENMRKYFEKEKEQIIKTSNKELMGKLLEVLDDFDSAVEKNKDEGLRMIYEKITKILGKSGLIPIKAVGEKFNPYEHEALAVEGAGDIVISEMQKGYKLNGVVIRPSKVKLGGESDEQRKSNRD